MAKLTPLQIATLGLIAEGKVHERNCGTGAWRIWGAGPSVVGRLRALKLAESGRPQDGIIPITLTAAGVEVLTFERDTSDSGQGA